MEKLSDKLKRLMTKLFSLDIPKFSKIIIYQSVIDNIIDFAKSNYPKEFIALLSGEVKDSTLNINSLIYQPFSGSKRSSSMKINLPAFSKVVGSVHSHPSQNSTPSVADLQFFNKNGIIHLIIHYPYREVDISCYDLQGNIQPFSINTNE